jgi:flagellar biosynthesis component FlhA
MEIAKLKPSLGAWNNLRGVHPMVRKYGEKFFKEQEVGKKEKITVERTTHKRMKNEQKDLEDRMTAMRNELGKDLGFQPHLIASKEQLREYVISADTKVFRKWQSKLLGI